MRRFSTFPLFCVAVLSIFPGARSLRAQAQGVLVPAPVVRDDPAAAPGNQGNQGADDAVPVLQYPNNPVSDILALYEKLTGKVLIRDSSLSVAGSRTISLISTKPISKAEAIHLIEASLLLNGYSLVPDTENRVKVLYAAPQGMSPRSEGVPLYDSSSALPQGNQVVSYFMPFRFIPAADAFTVFKEHVVLHNYGEMIEVPNAQALVITENVSLIRELLDLQELIDVPPARQMSEFITLKHADADRVAETISALLDADKGPKQHPSSASANPTGAGGVATPPGGAPIIVGGGDSGAQLVPDARTNRILVIARPATFPYIKNLIEQFDEDVGTATPVEHLLKYASAPDLLQVLADALAENGEKVLIQAPPTKGGGASTNQATDNSNNAANNGSNGSSAPQEAPDVLHEEQDSGPTSVIVGKTHLIANNKANSIIVVGPPESQAKVGLLLEKLDKRPAQVYIRTIIGQLTLTNDKEVGVDYAKLFNTPSSTSGNQNGFAGSVMNTTTSLIDPRTLTAAAAFPATGGLSLYGTIGKNLSVYIHALESTNRFKVISRPVVYAANNKRAEISSGQRVPYPSGTISDVANTGTDSTALQSTIAYQDVELKLEVIPLINADNEVNLKIAQVNDTLAGTQTISANQVPTISTQKIVTTVTVPDGETVVLGGLITESTTNNVTGIPILMHLPWVGQAFRDTSKKKERDELIVFIQPNVVNSNTDIVRASNSEKSRARVGKEAANFAPPEEIPQAQLDSFFPKGKGQPDK